MDSIEAAWSAGLFEGEGCLNLTLPGNTYRKRGVEYINRRHYVTLTVVMTDFDVIQKFADVVKFGTVSTLAARDGNKPCLRWRTSKWEAVEHLFEAWAPHLGERRRSKFQEALRLRCEDQANPALQQRSAS